MNFNKLTIVDLAKIARDYISEFAFAGCGMYNLGLGEDKRLSFKNDGGMIWQIYPYEGGCYLCSYILNYYKVGADNYEHDDIEFTSLSDSDRNYIIEDIFNALKINLENNGYLPTFEHTNNEDMKTIEKTKNVVFVRGDVTPSVLARLINLWNEDRGATECEDVFDIKDKTDFVLFANAYGLDSAVMCYNSKHQFWFGGYNFKFDAESVKNDTFTKMNIVKPMDYDTSTAEWICDEIALRIDDYTKSGEFSITEIDRIYDGLFDVSLYSKKSWKDDCLIFYNSSLLTDVDAKDCDIVEQNENWEYWYITLKNGEHNAVLRNRSTDEWFWCDGNGAYPACLADAPMYTWSNPNDCIMFNSDFLSMPIDVTLRKRLGILNHADIAGEYIDGVIMERFDATSITFLNHATMNRFIAEYVDGSFTAQVPLSIYKECGFSLFS